MTKIKLFKTLLTLVLISCSLFVQGQWKQKNNIWGFSQGIWGGQSFAVDGKIYFGGGYSGNNTNYNDLQVYDISTDTWAGKNNMPGATNRSGAVTFVINNKVYLGLGIQDFNSFNIPNWTFLTDLWEYNASADSWTQKASAPGIGRGFSGVFVINNKAYIVGGTTTKLGGGTDEVLEYDPATDTWTTKASFPEGEIRDQPFSFSIGDKGYIAGGRTPSGRTNKTYEYNPATNTWTAKKEMPVAEIAGGVSFVINGKGYCTWGGIDNGAFNKSTFAYSPSANDWEYVSGGESIRPGRMFGRAEVVNGIAYLGAGWRIDVTTQTFYRDFFEFNTQGVLSVNSINNNEQVVVYPNPATDKVFIKNAKQGGKYAIYNMFGQQVVTGILSNSLSINTNSLSAGQYIIKYTDKASVKQYQVTIQ
ncbi:MAG: kelch repeat-containing protein [Flavipsychrobacter sp.]